MPDYPKQLKFEGLILYSLQHQKVEYIQKTGEGKYDIIWWKDEQWSSANNNTEEKQGNLQIMI
jgi:hypothetical protein